MKIINGFFIASLCCFSAGCSSSEETAQRTIIDLVKCQLATENLEPEDYRKFKASELKKNTDLAFIKFRDEASDDLPSDMSPLGRTAQKELDIYRGATAGTRKKSLELMESGLCQDLVGDIL